jgi:hypothetical protein
MPNDLPYEVVWSRKVIDALKEFGKKANQSTHLLRAHDS